MKLFGGGAAIDWLIVGLGNPGREHAHTRHNVGFMVADELASRWELPRPKDRFRGRIAEGTVQTSPIGGGGVSTSSASDSIAGVSGSASREGVSASDSRERVSGGHSREEVSAGVSAKTGPSRARARVALLWPQTYMNDAGRSVGPARGMLELPLEHVLVVHDEIDLPFGEVRTRLGGGLAGHNGLKSLRRELGSADFMRVRVGVGRPKSTDPEIVSSYVLGRFREPQEDVRELIDGACAAVERVLFGEE